MPKAVWKGAVLAESDQTVMVEGNHYFRPEAVNREYFRDSQAHTTCYWKGVASYYDIEVGEDTNRGAAWYYPDPSDAAASIKNYIAFWRGVKVEK